MELICFKSYDLNFLTEISFKAAFMQLEKNTIVNRSGKVVQRGFTW